MKGYCVDVRGFSVDKKRLVVKAIGELTELPFHYEKYALDLADKIVNIGSPSGSLLSSVEPFAGELTPEQDECAISFNDLMIEAGFNYEDNGVEDFKCIDWSEREVTESKPTSNKTRPRITREQYDAVMAQSDKRTFTKALDDLLAIEKEQLLDESEVRIKKLGSEIELLNRAVELKDARLNCALDIVNQLERENDQFRSSAMSSKVENYASTGDVSGVDNVASVDAHYDLCGRRCERIIYSIVSLLLLAALVVSLFFR